MAVLVAVLGVQTQFVPSSSVLAPRSLTAGTAPNFRVTLPFFNDDVLYGQGVTVGAHRVLCDVRESFGQVGFHVSEYKRLCHLLQFLKIGRWQFWWHIGLEFEAWPVLRGATGE